MPVLALVVVALVVACGAGAIFAAVGRLRTPAELRGDWWREFEREFRAYARRAAGDDRRRGRHRGKRA
jgi:hypothetical protein